MILEGLTDTGAVVPVQVTAAGKVVAEGRTGPEGPAGPEGPQGPEGPPGPAGGNWILSGTRLHPADDLAEIETQNPISFADLVALYASLDGAPDGSGGRLSFSTTPSGSATAVERMRIQESGNILVNFDGSSQTGSFRIADGTAASPGLTFWADGLADTGIFRPAANTFSISTNASERLRITAAGQTLVDGGAVGPLTSDERLKTDIVDAPSQWDDLKAIRLTKFRYKGDDSGKVELGPIAQELEKVCPGLIVKRRATEEEIADPSNTLAEGDEVMTYKMTVLYMKAVGALQEAMIRIEKLEAILYANK